MCKIGRYSRIAAGIAMLACTQLWAQVTPAPVVKFNIESQPLAKALNTWAEQAGLQIVWPAGDPAGYAKSPPVQGRLEPIQALRLLLKDTGLTYSVISEGRTVAIHGLESPSGVKTTSAQGAPSSVDDELRLAHANELNTPDAARADGAGQEQDSGSTGHRDDKAQELVVTGSRLLNNTDRRAAPITIFDRDRIEQLGVSSVADVLNYLPQQSFAFNEQVNFAGSRVVRLRGLGIGTTLVLIDGRRTVTSALLGSSNAFDLNTIPLPAVERIEILSDSASAVYGTDAVGGVLNIILKRDIERPVLDVHYATADGGADERRISLAAGHSGRLRTSIVFDAFKRGFLLGEERERYANKDFRRFGSTDMRSPFANPGNITSSTTANLPGLSSRFAAVPVGSAGVGLTPASFVSTAGQTNLESIPRFTSVIPRSERLSGLARAEFDLGSDASAFADVLYVDREELRLNNPSVVNNTVPISNYFNPFGVAVSARFLLTGLGPQRERSDSESLRAVGGIRGQAGDWDWEFSALRIDEDGTNRILNAIDAARLTTALASNDPTRALNVFQDGPGGSPAVLDSLLATPRTNRYASDALQGAAFVRGPLLQLPAGRIQSVLGAETRREEMLFDSTTFVNEDRRSLATYAELQVPVLRKLTFTVAGRYDDYSDFGGTFNAQYGAEWKPVEPLSLRASYGTSFLAPSLFLLYQPVLVSNTSITDPRRANESAPYTLTRGGNTNLEPEESDSLSLGFVIAPARFKALKIGATYWKIEQDRRLQTLTSNLILANEALFPSRVTRADPLPADVALGRPGRLISIDSTTVNFGRLKTSGIDVQVSDVFTTAFGDFSPLLSATWVETYRAATFPDTPAVERVGLASTQGTIPRWRATATLGWSRRGIGISTTGRYISAYDDATLFDVKNGRTVGSQTLVDLEASFDLGELIPLQSAWLQKLKLRIGALNLLDEEPRFSEVGGNLGFDPVQGDIVQRLIHVSASKQF